MSVCISLLVWVLLLGACSDGTAEAVAQPSPTVVVTTTSTTSTTTIPTTSTTTTSTSTTTTTTIPIPPATSLVLEEIAKITGEISPKSIVHSGTGLFFAQNMMYRHTVTVYDRNFELVATIPDTVDLTGFGYGPEHRGAPVEAAFTSGGAHAYVSNYQMSGTGFGKPGGDACEKADWDESFVYRIDTRAFQIDQVIPVGAVPKFVAVSPDDRYLLVANWCGFDVSVVDVGSGAEIDRVEVGRHPRGIAVAPDSSMAYVAVMGSRDIAAISLGDFSVNWIRDVGANPRHLVMSADGAFLFVTLNGEGRVAKVDLSTGAVTGRVETGRAPRSMAISEDGSALYVANYGSDTIAKVATGDLGVLQTLPVAHHPIGITFDAGTRQVWVASYSGVITVFQEDESAES